MAKEAKKKPAEGNKSADRAITRESVVYWLKSSLTLLFIGMVVWAYLRTRDHVARNYSFGNTAPRVVLKERPAWMSDALAARISRVAMPDVAHSAFDHQLLVSTASLLSSHPDSAPWIKSVRSVRRLFEQTPGDVLEIDCEFRAPIALVESGLYFWLVDENGVLLPEQFAASEVRRVMYDQAHRLNLRVIEGVASNPPVSGEKWPGGDLAAGIEMVRHLSDKPYAAEIERISVSNFAGRLDPREAQLVLLTRYNTQVRWGRPISAKDYLVEVPVAQKFQYMEKIVQQFGRVDANHSAVDLRFDVVTYPAVEAPGTEANIATWPNNH